MEGLIALVVLVVVLAPIGFLVALLRHGSRLREMEERNGRLQDEVSWLRRKVAEMEAAMRTAPTAPVKEPGVPPVAKQPERQTEVSPNVVATKQSEESFDAEEPVSSPSHGHIEMPPPLPSLASLPEHLVAARAAIREVETTSAPSKLEPAAPEKPLIPAFNWEQFMGVKLFAWVGGLALFLGLAFFVKYSFERNLIPPELRVAIGFLVGIGLVVGGVLMRSRNYTVMSQTLCATGVVSLYGVTFACRSIYQFPFFGPVPTLLLMALITATAFTLAVRMNAMVVAVLGLLGGFLTPLLVSSGRDNPAGLFTFIALLDIGLLAVVLRMRWNNLVGLAAAGTLITQLGWMGKFFSENRYFEGNAVLVAMAVFGGFALLFAAASWWAARRQQGSQWLTGSALTLIGAAAVVALHFNSYSTLAGRPGIIFGYLLLIDALAIAMVWKQTELRQTLPVAGAVALGILGIWILGLKDTELLNWALGFVFVFALIHTLLPIWLARVKPELAGGSWTHAFPPLALCLLLPMFRFQDLPWLVWPLVFLVDAVAVVLAFLTASILAVLAVLVISLVLVAFWIFNVPVNPGVGVSVSPMLVVIGAAAVFFAAVGWFLAKRWAGRTERDELLGTSPELAARLLPVFAGVLPFLLLIMMVLRLPLAGPSAVFGLGLALVVLMLGLARALKLGSVAAVAMGAMTALEYAWFAARVNWPAHGWEFFGWTVGFWLLFAFAPFVLAGAFRERRSPWIAAALSGPLHFLFILRGIGQLAPNDVMGVVPGLMALPAFGQLFWALKLFPGRERVDLEKFAWFGGVALFFITLIFPIQFEKQWLTVAWALEGAALCWLFHRVPHPGLRTVGVGLLVAAFLRLAVNPAVLSYHARAEMPVWNWYLYTYGLAIAALFTGASMLREPWDNAVRKETPGVLCSLGTVLAFLLLNIEIADYFTAAGEPVLAFRFSGSFALDMAYTIAWSLFALGLLVVGIWKSVRGARYAAVGLLSVTLLKLFFHDLARLDAAYRWGALMVVGAVAFLASFIYQRFLSTPPGKDDNSK